MKSDQVVAADCLTCGWKDSASTSDGSARMTEVRDTAHTHAESQRHRVLFHRTTEMDGRPEVTK